MHDSSSLFEMEFGAGLEPAYSGFAVHLLANRTPELQILHKYYTRFVAQCQALLLMFNGEEFLQCG